MRDRQDVFVDSELHVCGFSTRRINRLQSARAGRGKSFPRVQFCYDETTGGGHSVYLRESREQAEEFFSPAFVEHFREVFGVDPTIACLDIPVLVDNRDGDIVVNKE